MPYDGNIRRRACLYARCVTYRDGGVDVVLSRDRVGSKDRSDLGRREPSVCHAREDRVGRVGRLRNKSVGGDLRDVGATSEELEARATSAVGNADCTSELDAKQGIDAS